MMRPQHSPKVSVAVNQSWYYVNSRKSMSFLAYSITYRSTCVGHGSRRYEPACELITIYRYGPIVRSSAFAAWLKIDYRIAQSEVLVGPHG